MSQDNDKPGTPDPSKMREWILNEPGLSHDDRAAMLHELDLAEAGLDNNGELIRNRV
jgi:hypothetical protein